MAPDTISPIAHEGTVVQTVDVTIGPQFLELFSEHLYASPNKAFEELLSNSWDAGASVVHVGMPADLSADDSAVWVLDNGESMDLDGLNALWAVAVSNKPDTHAVTGRPQIGKFGIGKLATYLLANELTYICKTSDGLIRAVTMDYRRINAGPVGQLHMEPVPLEVRQMTDDELTTILTSVPGGETIASILASGVATPDTDDSDDEFGFPDDSTPVAPGSWTLAVMTSLKDAGRAMQAGRIKRMLRSALPLGRTISIVFNDELLTASKSDVVVSEQWILGPGLGIAQLTLQDGTTLAVEEQSDPFPHLRVEGLEGIVTGKVRLYEGRISGGKSEGLGVSNGFFVDIKGRVVNADDPYFGLENLSHSAWAKFRATIRADGLNDELAVNREGLLEGAPLGAIRELLYALFNRARSHHDAAARAAWPQAGDILIDRWGVLPLEPLREAAETALRNPDVAVSIFDTQGVTEPEQALADLERMIAEEPGTLVREVVLEELASDAPWVRYDLPGRRVVVNGNHPFSKEHGSTREELVLLRDAAFVEVLTDAYMLQIGIAPSSVDEIRGYREDMLRLVAQVRRQTGVQIAELLLSATAHAKGLEVAVGDALEYLGYSVERLAQSGEPEGVATAKLTPDEADNPSSYSLTYDAKSSKHDKVKTKDVGVATLKLHRDHHSADGALVVAPDFEIGNLEAECQEHGITPMRAGDLARLLLLAAARGPLELQRLKEVLSIASPDAIHDWIEAYAKELEERPRLSLEEFFGALATIGHKTPDALTSSVVADRIRTMTGSDVFPARHDVEDVARGLAILAPGLIRLSGERIVLGTGPSELRAAIGQQIASVPKEVRFGMSISDDVT